MSYFRRLTQASIEQAFQLLEHIDDGLVRENSRLSILEALVHGEPEYVRAQLAMIAGAWDRFLLLTELYAAHGQSEDLGRLKSITPDEEFPDDEEEDLPKQIEFLQARVATGWRSSPGPCILSPEYRATMLARSDERIKNFGAMGAPEVCLFNEYCLRIDLGDYDVIGKAKALARGDSEYRDRITMAIAKAHAHNGSLARARRAFEAVMLPCHRIEVLLKIASLESELGVEPTPIAPH